MRRLIAVALVGIACAQPGMPPGGPPDIAAPQIIGITPDSGAVGVKPKEVLFKFDEVVAERPPSATSLSDLFLISPRDGVPDASWHRDVVGVKPTHGWRANTPYTVILMGGLADIRGNVRNIGASTFFSTGTAVPHTRISGAVFDWVAGTPASGALIEALIPPDTIHPYVALVDSAGRFAIDHLPPTQYTLRAYLDRNKNLSIDPSEPWDSTNVKLTDSARVDFLIFVHDTLPPRLTDVRSEDSVTIRVRFDRPIDPTQTLTTANFAVIGPDSAAVPIQRVGPPPVDTSAAARPAVPPPAPVRNPGVVRGQPPAAPRDTTPRPKMAKPSPTSEVQIKLQRQLLPKTAYHVRAIGIRGLLGRTGDSERVYTVPAAPPAPTTPPAKPPPAK
ncbi:MAG TPA: Ig-like domain-containing protein, partial [Gemmatimonadaceae bacterium]|nr:Ig-like domain-containing protein [Gemmatimonadaceae bacterium]